MTSPRPEPTAGTALDPAAAGAHVDLPVLLAEYRRALDYTSALTADLTDDEILWRPHPDSSAIGWHLGHQAAVAHFMVRNLTAAEPSPDPELDGLMDSATPERQRGGLPSPERILAYRSAVEQRFLATIDRIASGDVGAPAQLSVIAVGLLTAVINHEYQHSQWIGEVRNRDHGHDLPPRPTSDALTELDGYLILRPGTGFAA